MDSPNWDAKHEAQFKAQLTEQAYVHEILAEFGTQDKGVFPKDKLDEAIKVNNYAYNELDVIQKRQCEEIGKWPTMYLYDRNNRPAYNPFRTVGVEYFAPLYGNIQNKKSLNCGELLRALYTKLYMKIYNG